MEKDAGGPNRDVWTEEKNLKGATGVDRITET